MTTTLTFAADTLTPVRAYAGLRRAAKAPPQAGRRPEEAQMPGASFLLESVAGGTSWSRYSILGYRPRYEAVLHDDGPWEIHGEQPGFASALVREGVDPLVAAAALVDSDFPKATAPLAERIARSHIGYFGWGLVHRIARVPGFDQRRVVARLLGRPVVCVFDSLAQTVTIAADDEAAATRARADLECGELGAIGIPERGKLPSPIEVSVDDFRFETAVRRAQEYIAAGDAFQIVLARTFSVPQRGRDPFDVYRALRLVNPSPYMYFLDFGASQILGASPETLVHLARRGDGSADMTVRPIAGTRRRGLSPDDDDALERELLADEKERAEHVMLVDLGRNDVGQVANVGTVRVVRNMEVDRYSHVMHIVSEVTGAVSPSVSPTEVLRAAFPAGTLSGAPKLRAMQIIRELEGRPRGLYGGAVGYLGADMDFAIAIRTAVCENGKFEVTAGAGVVEASSPSAEAEETRNKARGVLCAIESAATR
ncbi:MAG TPA: anthranilate synthase component I family protein [Polyangiaceae bacterium]|jgi:anthranilate synthase component 1